MTRHPGWVYLIHFNTPLHHARHYLGWSSDLEQRLEDHWHGRGARLLEVLHSIRLVDHDSGLDWGWTVVRVWRGGRSLERQLKRRKASPSLCPLCNPALRNRIPRSAPDSVKDAIRDALPFSSRRRQRSADTTKGA